MSKIETFFNIIKNAQKVSSLTADRKARILDFVSGSKSVTLISKFTNQYHDEFLDALFAKRISMKLIEDNCGYRISNYQSEFIRNVLFTDDFSGFSEWTMTAYSHYMWCSHEPNHRYVSEADVYASHAVACMFLDFTAVDFLVEATRNSELKALASDLRYRHSLLREDDFIYVAEDVLRKWRLGITRKYPDVKLRDMADHLTNPDNRVNPFDLDAYLKLAELEALLKSE